MSQIINIKIKQGRQLCYTRTCASHAKKKKGRTIKKGLVVKPDAVRYLSSSVQPDRPRTYIGVKLREKDYFFRRDFPTESFVVH